MDDPKAIENRLDDILSNGKALASKFTTTYFRTFFGWGLKFGLLSTGINLFLSLLISIRPWVTISVVIYCIAATVLCAISTSWYRALGATAHYIIETLGLGATVSEQLIRPVFASTNPSELDGLDPKEARARLKAKAESYLGPQKALSLSDRILRRIMLFCTTVFFWGIVREATEKQGRKKVVRAPLLNEKMAAGIDGLFIGYVDNYVDNVTGQFFRIYLRSTIAITALSCLG